MKIEKTTYSHYGNVVKLTNGTVDVMVTTDVGPRVIYYGFCGGTNILGELPVSEAVKTDFGDWHPYGGHRLWAAPEAMPRSYWPDNSPVNVETVGDSAVRLTPPLETGTGLQKCITVTLSPSGTQVSLEHTITNKGIWPVELACWALTIMNGGGTTIFPQEPFKPHGEVLLPARPLVLWNYTDMTDPRWTFGKKYIRLRTDKDRDFAQKIGAAVKSGWAAYLREGLLFVKRFPYQEDATYPDFGCNFETFTKGTFMEVESVGPLVRLDPGMTVGHTEKWFLFKDVKAGETEESLDAAIRPLVTSIP
ncbi:MAG: hypothetical protein ACP5R5_03470 [Armatimonadota bacterium]